jgi:1-phosphatidylinositol-3-phosphate 5-kinase
MVKHVRYFAHGEGAVYINMKNLESPIPGFSKILLTWSWCKICKQVLWRGRAGRGRGGQISRTN